MEQNQTTPPSPQPPQKESTPNTLAEDRVPQIWHHPQVLPLRPNLVPTIKLKAPMTRANWVNAFWADISGQLRRLAVVSSDLFDGLLLRKHTPTGSLILRELRYQYEELGNNRSLACVRVMAPENPMRGMWQLYWTIKREKDVNGRQFHSQITIDPINNTSHLELDNDPGQTSSAAQFPLPPFIQDYGPGPAEFDFKPEDEFYKVFKDMPEDEFDKMFEPIMRGANAGNMG